MPRRILIVGGGVAGPSLGIALNKIGSDAIVTIIEAYPRAETAADIVGSYFTLQENGVDTLNTLGALEAVRSAGFATTSAHMMRGDGRVLASMPFGDSITARRGEVNRILMDMASALDGCTVRYSTRLVSCRQEEVSEEGGDAGKKKKAVVVATLVSNGGEPVEETFDLIVGADGVHSSIRKAIDPKAPNRRFVGLINYAGISPPPPPAMLSKVPSNGGLAPHTWNFCFARNAFILYHIRPDGSVLWGVNEPQPEPMSPSARAALTLESVRSHLLETFAADCNPLISYLVSNGTIELMGDSQHDLGSVPRWYNSEATLVLVGDAVHAPSPTSGQGGSMALEDGIALAKALHENADSNADALAAYERFRRPRVERIVEYGARMSNNKMPNAFGRFMRDLFMPLAMKCIDMTVLNRWVGSYRIVWDLPLASQPPAPEPAGVWDSLRFGVSK